MPRRTSSSSPPPNPQSQLFDEIATAAALEAEAITLEDGLEERPASSSATEVDDQALRRHDGDLRHVRHPVEMAAIVPKTRKLTLLAMRHWLFLVSYALGTKGTVSETGVTWRVQLSTFRRDVNYTSNDTEHLRESLRQCQRALVEWADPATDKQTGERVEWASTQLLGSCEFVIDAAGRRCIEFSFPPTLLKQMLAHKHFFESSLAIVSQLSRYSSLALFRLVRRHKTSPSGMTKALPWREWIPILTGESEESAEIRSVRRGAVKAGDDDQGDKYREWRYFNRDVVGPAVTELNLVLEDVWVEAVPIKHGRTVEQLRFKVIPRDGFKLRRDGAGDAPPEYEGAVAAMTELGLVQSLAIQLCKEHTPELMLKVAEQTKQRVNDKRKPPVDNVQGLLITIKNEMVAAKQKVEQAGQQVVSRLPSPDKAADESLEEYRNSLSARARREWESMPTEVKDDYLRMFAEDELPTLPAPVQVAHKKSGIEPPLVRARFFIWLAKTMAGDEWTPSDRTLLAFERSRRDTKP